MLIKGIILEIFIESLKSVLLLDWSFNMNIEMFLYGKIYYVSRFLS